MGGRSKWLKVLGSTEVIGATSGDAISNYCIIDKDYYNEQNDEKIRQEAEAANITLFIWNSKEIENYLINAKVLSRLINKQQNDITVSEEDINNIINTILDEAKIEIICQYGTQIQKSEHGYEFSTIAEKAKKLVNDNWDSMENKIKICPGKAILKKIKHQIQETYGVSFPDVTIAKNFKKEEIHSDISNAIKAIV